MITFDELNSLNKEEILEKIWCSGSDIQDNCWDIQQLLIKLNSDKRKNISLLISLTHIIKNIAKVITISGIANRQIENGSITEDQFPLEDEANWDMMRDKIHEWTDNWIK